MVLVVKNLPASTGDIRDRGSIPGSGRSPERGYGNPLQYSCPENAMDRGAWLATVHRVTRSMLSTHASFRNTGLNPLNQNSWAGTLMSACLITTADVYHEHLNLRIVFLQHKFSSGTILFPWSASSWLLWSTVLPGWSFSRMLVNFSQS